MTDEANDPPEKGNQPKAKLAERLQGARMIAAGAIVLIYICVAVWLIINIANGGTLDPKGKPVSGAFGDEEWKQIVYLLTAIGTLATGAAGVLIGVQVQQGSVNAANDRAAKADAAASDAKQEKQKVQKAIAEVVTNMPQSNDTKAGQTEVKAMQSIKEDLRSVLTI